MITSKRTLFRTIEKSCLNEGKYYTALILTGYDPDEVSYLCKNGDSYLDRERCIYETDMLGVMKTCRDATHLEDCG